MAELRATIPIAPATAPVDRVDRCLKLLQEEMASPSSPEFGMGGGPIDSGYLQEVIMGDVCTFAQKQPEREEIRQVVAKRLESTPKSDKAMRERLTIMLGICGDKSVVTQLIDIMEHHKEGYMRFEAAWSLQNMGDCEGVIPAFKRVVERDTYARIRFSDSKRIYDSKAMVYSPVRDVAASALTRLGQDVPKDIEVIDAKYAVQRLEPLLYYPGDPVTSAVIETLGMIGGKEAKTALQRFIEKGASISEKESLVKEAREALAKTQALR